MIKLDHVGGDLTDHGKIFQRVERHNFILIIGAIIEEKFEVRLEFLVAQDRSCESLQIFLNKICRAFKRKFDIMVDVKTVKFEDLFKWIHGR